jgi:hypothetical protein
VTYGPRMGLFGGMSEEELRTGGTQTTARVTYVEDTGKRREGGAQAKVKVRLKIDSGSARGRELDQAKWVPVTRMPHSGETVSIRIDTDDIDDWAWGDAAMYAPATTVPAAPVMPAAPAAPGAGPAQMPAIPGLDGLPGLQQMIASAFAAGNVSVEQSSHVIDLRGESQQRDQMLATLRAQGIDIEAMQHGAPPQTPADASAASIAERLRKLDTLRDQGLLSEDEHRAMRQRIIDSI